MPKGKVTTLGTVTFSLAFLAGLARGQGVPSAELTLYRQLRSAGISPATTHQIRDAGFDREDIHISLQDGAIAFTEAVDGHVTGAFFQGEGEVLLIPPDRAERASLALFTGFPVLEEKFSTAYFRFDDDTATELAPALRPPEDAAAFVQRWGAIAKSLAEIDALRLLAAFTNTPVGLKPARFLHARFGGVRLGTFDVFLDSSQPEQISVAQAGYTGQGQLFYDVWMSLVARSRRGEQADNASQQDQPFVIPEYKMAARILPPHEMDMESELTVRCRRDGLRTLVFELSRYLRVSKVLLAEQPVVFIQNEAVAGSELERRGNDLVTVLLPAPLQSDQEIRLKFNYAGSVMTEAGGGLMYVGARGIWYPNRGPAMAKFDLEFRYPKGWTLLATGVLTSSSSQGSEQVAHWTTQRPIPLAGFNLGQYVASQAHAGETLVSTYGARGVEQTLASGSPPATSPETTVWRHGRPMPSAVPQRSMNIPETRPAAVEQEAVAAVDFLSQRLGNFPYPSLSLTQMPGASSQGWPGLIFLSSYVFLPAAERPAVPPADQEYDRTLYDQLMTTHEVAHQWWGDAVLWKGYRDQWLMEALANYCALLQLEATDPQRFRHTMERYRQHLLKKNPRGLSYSQAGAVTLGVRLSSSKFPDGYETVAYERGSWLIHMLRGLLGGDTQKSAAQFFEVMRRLQQRFAGQVISTLDFQHALEEELPDNLRFERRKSLDWFFDSWVNGVAIPRIALRDVHFSARGRGLVAAGTLTQQDAGRDLVTSVPIYARMAASAQPVFAGRIFADGEETTFRLTVPAGTKELVVDPYNTILRQ